MIFSFTPPGTRDLPVALRVKDLAIGGVSTVKSKPHAPLACLSQSSANDLLFSDHHTNPGGDEKVGRSLHVIRRKRESFVRQNRERESPTSPAFQQITYPDDNHFSSVAQISALFADTHCSIA